MGKEIRAMHEVRLLFPRAVEEWVGPDHPARFLRAFVRALDLEELGFRRSWTTEGRPQYASELLLGAWLYGYLNQVRSSRKLERACREHLGLVWLLGGEEPDHNTLWRFWREHREAIKRLFKQTVKVAAEAGALGMCLHALDGTKIEAASGGGGVWSEGRLEQARESVERYVEELEEAVERGGGEGGDGYRLPEELCDALALQRRIGELVERMREEETKYLHEGEPEARMMKCDGRQRLGYNAQAVVDGESGLIVAQAVVNDRNDLRQLSPMVERVAETVGESAGETVADSGYRSMAQIAKAEEAGHRVLVQLKPSETEEAGPYHTSRFEYDKEQDCCVCPRGKRLEFEREGWTRGRLYRERYYRCHHAATCPVAGECSRDPRGRKVTVSQHHETLQRQRERQRSEAGRARLRKRKQIVERAFAEIKHHMGFRRWSFRGLEGAGPQWAMMCTVFNLKRLHRLWVGLQPGFG